MGFQVYPTPVSASTDLTTFGFDVPSGSAGTTISQSLPAGQAIFWSTFKADKGIYESQPVGTAGSTGFIRFAGAQLQPSSTTTVKYTLTTDATTVGMVIQSNWQAQNVMVDMFSLSTAKMMFWKIFDTNVQMVGTYSTLTGLNPIAISTSGNSWTKSWMGFSSTQAHFIYTGYYKNGEYFAWGTFNGANAIVSSTDLVNWATRSTEANPGQWGNAFYDTTLNRFYATGNAYSRHVKTSTNGINWSTAGALNTTTGVAYGVKRVNNFLIAFGWEQASATTAKPLIEVSTNGTNWTLAETINSVPLWSTNNTPSIWDVEFGNGYYVAPVDQGQIIVSTNAINWTTTNFNTRNPGGSATYLNAVMFDGTYYIVTGDITINSGVMWSTDARNWSTSFGAIRNLINFSSGEMSFSAYTPNNPSQKYWGFGQAGTRKGFTTESIYTYGRWANVIGGSQMQQGNILLRKYNLTVNGI